MKELDTSAFVLQYETGCCCQEFDITEEEFYDFIDDPSITKGYALLTKCLCRDLESDDPQIRSFAKGTIEDMDRYLGYSSLSVVWNFYNKDMLTEKGKEYFFNRGKYIKEITKEDFYNVPDIHEDVV